MGDVTVHDEDLKKVKLDQCNGILIIFIILFYILLLFGVFHYTIVIIKSYSKHMYVSIEL